MPDNKAFPAQALPGDPDTQKWRRSVEDRVIELETQTQTLASEVAANSKNLSGFYDPFARLRSLIEDLRPETTPWTNLELSPGWEAGNQNPMWRIVGGYMEATGTVVGPIGTSEDEFCTGLPLPASGEAVRFATVGTLGRTCSLIIRPEGVGYTQSPLSPPPAWLDLSPLRYPVSTDGDE